MRKKHVARDAGPALQRPGGVRWLVYWCGRVLQVFGLVLIWWVLLLFAGTAGMGPLLSWSGIAAIVFYAGWACTMWGTHKW